MPTPFTAVDRDELSVEYRAPLDRYLFSPQCKEHVSFLRWPLCDFLVTSGRGAILSRVEGSRRKQRAQSGRFGCWTRSSPCRRTTVGPIGPHCHPCRCCLAGGTPRATPVPNGTVMKGDTLCPRPWPGTSGGCAPPARLRLLLLPTFGIDRSRKRKATCAPKIYRRCGFPPAGMSTSLRSNTDCWTGS